MQNKILSGLFALAILVATSYGVNESIHNDSNLRNLALLNVEALASGESGYPCKWRTDYINGRWFAICDEIGIGYDCSCGDVKEY